MIIQCEKCQTKFSLNESLLKNEGSKVRCSVCKHIFVAFPPGQAFAEEAETIAVSKEELEGALSQDSEQLLREEAAESSEKGEQINFDKVFEDSLGDLEKLEAVSSEDSYDLEKEEPELAVEPPDRVYVEEAVVADTAKKAEEEPKESAEARQAVVTQERPRKSHVLTIFLVIILVIVGSAAAIFFWAPELIPDSFSILKPAEKRELTDIGVHRLSFKSVTGSFVSSEKAGSLFVIAGMVVNDYPKSRSFILINGSILDDKGGVVKRKLAFAGNPLKAEEIKVMSLEEINKAMKNRHGMGEKNINVAPGASVPFTIVFENLPENLSEFTVEGVSSSPGT